MMPNVDDENFASGGIGAVAVLSGKRSAFASVRPLDVVQIRAAARWSDPRARAAARRIRCRSTSARLSLSSKRGARLPPGPRSTIFSASARATGALKRSRKGRSGVQGAFAFSRSHEKLAVKGSRTVKSKRFSTSFAMPLGPATPAP